MLRMWRVGLLSGLALAAAPAHAFIAYVSNEKSNTVSVIDTDSWTVTKTIKVGQRPRGIDFTRDGKFVMVAVGDDDTIQMIDTKTNQIADTLPSGPDPEVRFRGEKSPQWSAGRRACRVTRHAAPPKVPELLKRLSALRSLTCVREEGMTADPTPAKQQGR